MSLSTHILDQQRGIPAAGVPVTLMKDGLVIGKGLTDSDGRYGDFFKDHEIEPGAYQLLFDVEGYFSNLNVDAFYREIPVAFEISDTERHYHVPLLLSPFGYSTYRGS